MSLGAIGAMLAVLFIIFVVGNLWFHIVEGGLDIIKRLLFRREQPWHPLPADAEQEKEENLLQAGDPEDWFSDSL